MNEPDIPDPYRVPTRERLVDTRPAITRKFKIKTVDGEIKGWINVGLYPDGRPGELFIKMDKSEFNGWTNTIGILTSIALQSGVPLEVLVKKLEFQKFPPTGFTTDSEIRFAHSIVDYVFRWLGRKFIEGYGKNHADGVSNTATSGPMDAGALHQSSVQPEKKSKVPTRSRQRKRPRSGGTAQTMGGKLD